jgi:vitamin B12 transporter
VGAYGRSEADAALTGSAPGWRYALAAGISNQDGFSAKRAPAYQDQDGYRNERVSINLEYDLARAHQLGLHGMASHGESQYDDGAAAFDSRTRARIGNLGVHLKSTLSADWSSQLRADFAHEKVSTQGYFDASPWGPGSSYASRIEMDQWQYAWQLDGRTGFGAVQALLERLEWDVGGDVGYAEDRRSRNALLLGWRHDLGAHGVHLVCGTMTTRSLAVTTRSWPAIRRIWRRTGAPRCPTPRPSARRPSTISTGRAPAIPIWRRNADATSRRDVRYREADRQFGLNLYRNKVRDLIQWAPTGASGNWQPSNIARADLRGLGVTWRQALGNFGIRAGLDWQKPEDGATGKQLILRSREHASLGLDHALGDWTWSADWQLQGERYNDAANTVRLGGYGLLHLAAARQLTRDWSVQARLENAFDKDYERSSGYNTPGRNLFVSLRYQPR